jgi:hypothetical protein
LVADRVVVLERLELEQKSVANPVEVVAAGASESGAAARSAAC